MAGHLLALRLMQYPGVQAEFTTTLSEAGEIAKRLLPHVIVLDLCGIEATEGGGELSPKQVIATIGDWAPARVVILSGVSDSDLGAAALAAGAQDVIVKTDPAALERIFFACSRRAVPLRCDDPSVGDV